MTDTPDLTVPRTVVQLTVDSYQRIRAARVTPNEDGLVLVRGKNGQGKSSLIGSMLDAFAAEKSELPITEGQDHGEVTIDLGDLIVREKISRDAEGKAKRGFFVQGKDGTRYSAPVTVLKALRSHFADPVAFERMKPEDQVKTVLRVLGLDGKLRALEGQEETLFDERTTLGRDVDRSTKALLQLEMEAKENPAPVVEGDLDELQAELREVREHNLAITNANTARARANEDGQRAAGAIKRLEAELEAAHAAFETSKKEWMEAAEKLGELGQIRYEQPIEEKISALNAASGFIARDRMIEAAKLESEKAGRDHASKESELEAKRQEVRDLLDSVEFPVQGMGYDAKTKTLTLREPGLDTPPIPLPQASQAQRLRAAAGVAMAGNPSFRVLFIREASLLDHDSLVMLDGIARERKFQVWAEVVDSDREGVGIFIEDGEVFQDGAAEG